MDASPDTVATEAAEAAERVRVAEVGLLVRDLDRVTDFYRDVIGLAEVARDADHARLDAAGRTLLSLTRRPDALADDPREAGLFHTAFLMPSRAALADWLADAAARGAAIDGASDHAVSEAIYLTDPEGNGVEVYADRPRASWRWDGAQVRMTTERLDVADLLAARSRGGWRGAVDGTRIGHVHLRVGNVADAVRFWTGTVGLEVVAARPGAAFLSSGRYHHHVGANAWGSAGAGARPQGRTGLDYVRFDVDAPLPDMLDPWGTQLRFTTAGSPAVAVPDATGRFGGSEAG